MRGANFLALILIVLAFILFDSALRGTSYAMFQALGMKYQGYQTSSGGSGK